MPLSDLLFVVVLFLSLSLPESDELEVDLLLGLDEYSLIYDFERDRLER